MEAVVTEGLETMEVAVVLDTLLEVVHGLHQVAHSVKQQLHDKKSLFNNAEVVVEAIIHSAWQQLRRVFVMSLVE